MGFDALITLREPGRKRMGSRPVITYIEIESLVGRAWVLGLQITYIERA